MYILTPFLLAVFPGLFLFTYNFDITPVEALWFPLLLSLAGTGILLFIMYSIFKNLKKAGLFTSLTLILFFTYGSLHGGLYRIFSQHEAVTSSALIALLIFFFYRFRKSPKSSINNSLYFLSIIIVVLLSFQLVTITWNTLTGPGLKDVDKEITLNTREDPPDIFYLIVDGYGGKEILENIYDFDNELFLEKLRQRGFYIAEESWSNYSQTILSLASNLNFNYLNEFAHLPEESSDRSHLINSIKHNKVFELLEEKGYHTTSYFTVYSPVNITGADSYKKDHFYNLNEFSHYLLNHSWLSVLTKELQYSLYRSSIRFALENIPGEIQVNKPNFVYAHLLPPHPPFTFDSEGRTVDVEYRFSLRDGSHFPGSEKEYLKGYIEQVQFLNNELLTLIDEIKNISPNPIIIIQADHGPGSQLDWEDMSASTIQERMSILNATYFYDENYEQFHSAITPVNTFRIIFNQYFEAELELLEDKSFFSTWKQPYDFHPLRNN